MHQLSLTLSGCCYFLYTVGLLSIYISAESQQRHGNFLCTLEQNFWCEATLFLMFTYIYFVNFCSVVKLVFIARLTKSNPALDRKFLCEAVNHNLGWSKHFSIHLMKYMYYITFSSLELFYLRWLGFEQLYALTVKPILDLSITVTMYSTV